MNVRILSRAGGGKAVCVCVCDPLRGEEYLGHAFGNHSSPCGHTTGLLTWNVNTRSCCPPNMLPAATREACPRNSPRSRVSNRRPKDVKRAVRFYNDLLDLHESSTYRGVLRQNVADAFAAWHSTSRVGTRPCNFVRALFQVLWILLPSERGLQSCFRVSSPWMQPPWMLPSWPGTNSMLLARLLFKKGRAHA